MKKYMFISLMALCMMVLASVAINATNYPAGEGYVWCDSNGKELQSNTVVITGHFRATIEMGDALTVYCEPPWEGVCMTCCSTLITTNDNNPAQPTTNSMVYDYTREQE